MNEELYLQPRYSTWGTPLRFEKGRPGSTSGSEMVVEWLTIDGRDVSHLVRNGAWAADGPGEIEGVVVHKGVRYAIQGEAHPKVPIISDPLFADRISGNGFMAMIPPYPHQSSSGKSFGSIGELRSAIGKLGAGEVLYLNDMNFRSDDLTIPSRDYRGAKVVARNLHGVKVKGLYCNNVKNLHIQGIECHDEVEGRGSVNRMRFEYVQARRFYLGNPSEKVAYVDEHTLVCCTPRPPSKGGAAQSTFNRIRRLNLRQCIFGHTTGTGDIVQVKFDMLLIMQHVVMGDIYANDSSHHTDGIQHVFGELSGSVERCGIFDTRKSGRKKLNQAFFFADSAAQRDFYVGECVADHRAGGYHGFTLQKCENNVLLRNLSTSRWIRFESISRSVHHDSIKVENCVVGSTTGGGDGMLAVPASEYGLESDMYHIDRHLGGGNAAFPNWDDTPVSWKNMVPIPAHAQKGAGAFLRQLNDAKND